MKQFLTVALALIALAQPLSAEDLIIESRPEGKNNTMYSEPVGGWLSSNIPADTAKSSAPDLTPQGTAGSRKLTPKPAAPAGTVVGSARFSPKFSAPGKFNVYATWGKAGNITPARYVVKHANGEETKEVSQDGWGAAGDANANQWVSLGQYDFNAEGGFVELQIVAEAGATSPATAQQASSDAVRFSTEPVAGAIVPSAAAQPQAVVVRTEPMPAVGSTGSIPIAGTPPALPVPTQSTGPIEWAPSYSASLTQAKAESKKLLFFFYIDGNPRSDTVEKTYLDTPKVKGVIKTRYVPVKINMTTDKELTQQFQVYRAGTILLYDVSGDGLDQITDITSPDALASRLAVH